MWCVTMQSDHGKGQASDRGGSSPWPSATDNETGAAADSRCVSDGPCAVRKGRRREDERKGDGLTLDAIVSYDATTSGKYKETAGERKASRRPN